MLQIKQIYCRSPTDSWGLPGQAEVSRVELHVQSRVGDPLVHCGWKIRYLDYIISYDL